jgi:hypothetical protein
VKKTALFSLAALAVLANHGAFAADPSTATRGITTGPSGAFVSPQFTHAAGVVTIRKAGPASSTSCSSPRGYEVVGFTYHDRAGSFPIGRPANVAGEVRYCVGRQAAGANTFDVKYDVIGE